MPLFHSPPSSEGPRAGAPVPWTAWLVLLVSISVSAWAYKAAESEVVHEVRTRFDVRVKQIETAVKERIHIYEQALRGARGLFAASRSVERSEWRAYVDSVKIAENYPGIKGMGFVEYVPRAKLETFLAETRSDGASDYAVHPPGIRAEYFFVKYMEPLMDNFGILGFDIATDTAARRPAAELARDRSRPTISGKILSASDTTRLPGVVFLLPVYRGGAAIETVDERRSALAGWIYCRFNMRDMLRDIPGPGAQDIGFEIFDGIEMSPETLLYGGMQGSVEVLPTFVYATTMEVGERVWMLNVFSRPGFDSSTDQRQPMLVLIAGFMGSFLLFSVVWSLAATRRLALAQAESMTAKLRSVLETSLEAFIATDGSGRIRDWNRQAHETFGWSREETQGRILTDLIFPPRIRETIACEMAQFLSTGKSTLMGHRIEFTALRRDGHEFPVEMTLWPIQIDGKFTFNVFVHDIAKRRLAQKELLMARDASEGANRAKSEFLANMSHELRTPLNSLIGFANILQEDKGKKLTDHELAYLDRILDNGRHLLNLINQVLDLSKVDAKQMELDIEPIYLDVFIRDTLNQLEGRVLGRDIKLIADLPQPMAPFETDATKLKQVLINLIGNAIKFTEKGTVTVRVKVDAVRRVPVRIDVVDTGIGIPPDKRETIFEAFQQIEGGASRKYGGTGLGLTISRSLCQLMGYRIYVRSAPGKGSTFSVEIPREPVPWGAPASRLSASGAPGAGVPDAGRLSASASGVGRAPGAGVSDSDPTSAGSAPPAPAGKVVLVIDDAPDSRILLTHFLEDMGFGVISVSSGEQGVQMARTRHPDLITVDLMMREKNGAEVIKELKSDPALRNIPVIVISAIAGDARSSLPSTVDVLNKPVDRRELWDIIRKNLPAPKGL